MTMKMFDGLLNYQVLAGSHSTAGQGGGCVNELALVASGRPWRALDARNLPEDFSRVLSGFAMFLNDHMPAHERQKLKMFVTKLAGVRDHPQIELERAYAIARYVGVDPRENSRAGPGSCTCAACRSYAPDSETILASAMRRIEFTGDWDRALYALNEACGIGRQPDPMDSYQVDARIGREIASAPKVRTSVPLMYDYTPGKSFDWKSNAQPFGGPSDDLISYMGIIEKYGALASGLKSDWMVKALESV